MLCINIRKLLLLSAIFRLILIICGEWQDAHMEVRYTDVDYFVFSDAASLMASGESPYKRTTYRYSPFLAFLLLPNSIIHRSWGKFLFFASDLLVGLFIYNILKRRNVPEDLCLYSVMVWLLNPFTFTIGTRGNCEPIVCALILWTIICLLDGNVVQAAFWYGLVVHFRIYPIIYVLPTVMVPDSRIFQSGQKPLLVNWKLSHGNTSQNPVDGSRECGIWAALKRIFARERIMFGLISGAVFLSFTAFYFYLYGWEFLNEALLYHLTRTDPRHNFSIYFYHIYLHYDHEFSMLVLIFCFAPDLPFCFFLQTVAFVAFNKVITAQYFVWFFCLLPFILPWNRMKFKWEGLCCMTLWIGAQIHWLFWGYLFEFRGKNVFLQLWLASLLFLAANSCVVIMFIRHHGYSPVFRQLEHPSYKKYE